MNDELKIHLASGNGTGRRALSEGNGGASQERMQDLKYGIFYLVVAAVLLVANQLTRNSPAAGDKSHSLLNLRMDLSVARKLERNRARSESGMEGTYVVRFRLTNEGNQALFYPVYRGTNCPRGQIVYRVAPRSDWRPLSEARLSLSTPTQPSVGGHVVWVEIPPGGWADGTYVDPGFPAGDHAYELDLKVASDGKESPFLSQAYPVNAN